MKKLVNFYREHFRKKLFNKILMIYSIITILSLATLSGFVYTYLLNAQVEKESNLSKQILTTINKDLDVKYAISQEIVQQIYESNTMHVEVNSFLRNSFSQYLDDRLVQFSNTSIRTRDITSFMRMQQKNNPDIRSISLYSAKKNFLYVLTKTDQHYYQIDTDLQAALSQYILTERSITTISNITSLNALENVGSLIIEYNSDSIYRSFENNAINMKGDVVVLTPEGKVIFDSSGRHYGKSYPYTAQLSSASSVAQFEEESYVNLQTTNRFGFWIAGIIPKSEIKDDLTGLRNILLLMTSICIIGAMSLTYFTIIHFSRRTRVIVKAMKRLQDGDLSIRIPMEKEDELSQISKRFNQMCEDLTLYIDQVYKSEIRQKHAELVALQAQINPHFLYNTLEAIRMRALSKKADDVGEMIYLLATMFRYSVKSHTLVMLSEEMEYCTLYLELFKIRYLKNFNYEVDIEPQLLNIPTLKLSIQPIIENYIVHGLVMSRTDNYIWIHADLEGDDLLITIRDNGSGINSEKLEKLRLRLMEPPLQPSHSIGLINVNERIKLTFGSKYGLHVESEPSGGASITIKIPANKGGKSHA